MNKKILMTGNEAFAKGALDAGCRFYAGYPITPQNELPAYMALNMPEAGGVFIQAESEISAVNMVFGASAAGVRSMTSSSSPGISLKQEGISYLAGAELPSVIINVMRAGPGLGNIWPSQSDYFQATRSAGHGDSHCIVLAPSTVQESYDIMFLAFDLADKYRNPVMILGDGLLGQMMEPVLFTNHHLSATAGGQETGDRRPATKLWALTGCKGRKRNIAKSFYLREGDLEKLNILLQNKYQEIQEKEERFEGVNLDNAELVLVGYGTMARIAKSAMQRLREENYNIGLIRPITLWPFPKKVFERYATGDKRLIFLAVEMSYGQMVDDVKLSLNGRFPVDFIGRSGGGVVSEEDIIAKVKGLLSTKKRNE
jgi:2-oxoglutarate ferredoxin oxidoreductase subunit alpha